LEKETSLHNLKQNISTAGFESHSQDARYTQQGNTSPACTAQWGTGGNNMPLVAEKKAFAMQRIGEYKENEQASTMKSRDYKDATDLVVEEKEVKCAGFPLGFRAENTKCYDEVATTLCNGTRPGFTTGCVLNWIVRRLTPVECERLQGFPDGWTDIGEWVDENGKKHKPADSPRYKALGNSIALPQWYWIFQKMKPYIGENPTLGSLFDGIGGFPLVFESTYGDGTAIWGSEIEPFCVAVTKKHFPEKQGG
jgi:DNA (cytosine-5)-methyltransferase 1